MSSTPRSPFRDGAVRLSPQTERIEAWQFAAAEAAQPRGFALRGLDAPAWLDAALRALPRFWQSMPPGLWHERMTADGRFIEETCRVSSLRHIVCAVDAVAGERPDELRGCRARGRPGRERRCRSTCR